MKHIKFIFPLFVLIFNSSVFSQTYSDTTWQRWYGEPDRHENPWYLPTCRTLRSWFIVIDLSGSNPYATILQKTDVNGKIIWDQIY